MKHKWELVGQRKVGRLGKSVAHVERKLNEERGKNMGLCTAEHSGWEGTEELGLYPVGNREPEKAVELERSWSDLHFGKISFANQCLHFCWPLPFRERCDPNFTLTQSTLIKTHKT